MTKQNSGLWTSVALQKGNGLNEEKFYSFFTLTHLGVCSWIWRSGWSGPRRRPGTAPWSRCPAWWCCTPPAARTPRSCTPSSGPDHQSGYICTNEHQVNLLHSTSFNKLVMHLESFKHYLVPLLHIKKTSTFKEFFLASSKKTNFDFSFLLSSPGPKR